VSLPPIVQRISELFEDLRRRRVVRAGGLYWIGSLTTLGVLDLLRDLLPWLDRAFPAIVLTAILLFPAVLVVAWAFDWTSEGLQLYRPQAGEGSDMLHRLGVVSVLAVATAGFGWGALLLWSQAETVPGELVVASAPPGAPTDIAVLYFDDYSPRGELAYLANGLTEGLINALGNVESLTVISRNGVRRYREGAVSSDSIAHQLGVGTLVMGSVTGEEGRVRVFAQLVDVTGGDEQLWSGRFERADGDILTLQSELVDEISAGLRQSLGVAVRSREAAAETRDNRAWLLFQEGKELMHRARTSDAAGGEYSLGLLDRADSLLVEARTRDPDWAAPVVERGWLAFHRSRLVSPMAGFVRPADSLALLGLADLAVEVSRASPASLELRGVVRFELAEATRAGGELRDRAEDDLRAALQQEPRRALALAYLADARRIAGDFADARNYAQRAMEVDAFLEEAPDVIDGLYGVNLELKAWSEADRWCREGRRRFRANLTFLFCRLQFEALRPQVGDPAVAWALLDTIRTEASVEDWDFQYRTWSGYQVARVLARRAMPDSAEAVLGAYAPALEDRPWFAYDEAHVRLVMGDPESALELLRLYLELAPDRRSYLPSDWLFEELWGDPRFEALMASADGLP
jgi:TolB-like protein